MELNELFKLATLLDANGEHKAASRIDALILKIAKEENINLPSDLLKALEESAQSIDAELDIAAIADMIWEQAFNKVAQDIPPAEPAEFRTQEVPLAKVDEFDLPTLPPAEPDKFDLPMAADDPGHVGLEESKVFEQLEQEFEHLYYRAKEILSPNKFKEFVDTMEQKATGRGALFGLPAKEESVMGPGVARDMSDIENELAMMEKGSATANVFEKLAVIADSLDVAGAKGEADVIDAFIRKHADPVVEDVADWKEEADTERSKRYDSKHHHDLQVREPKTENERVDYEGRKEHHVSTYKTSGGAGLSSRYCPDHIGAQMGRVGESIYQCPIDGKTYNWDTGYTDYEGNQVPGGSVAAQTPDSSGYGIPHRIFDTREVAINEVN